MQGLPPTYAVSIEFLNSPEQISICQIKEVCIRKMGQNEKVYSFTAFAQPIPLIRCTRNPEAYLNALQENVDAWPIGDIDQQGALYLLVSFLDNAEVYTRSHDEASLLSLIGARSRLHVIPVDIRDARCESVCPLHSPLFQVSETCACTYALKLERHIRRQRGEFVLDDIREDELLEIEL